MFLCVKRKLVCVNYIWMGGFGKRICWISEEDTGKEAGNSSEIENWKIQEWKKMLWRFVRWSRG